MKRDTLQLHCEFALHTGRSDGAKLLLCLCCPVWGVSSCRKSRREGKGWVCQYSRFSIKVKSHKSSSGSRAIRSPKQDRGYQRGKGRDALKIFEMLVLKLR